MFMLGQSAVAFEGEKTFMPPNNLHLEKAVGGLTEAQFNEVIDRATEVYGPIFSQFGATLEFSRLWSDNTVNASADQPSSTRWRVTMYGGLARRPEVTEDGFAMVICHEFGHHLAGFPFVQSWAANEGQSDYFATGACAFRLFNANPELVAKARDELPADMKAKCDDAHPAQDRDVCYRALLAGKSLGDLLAGGPDKVAFNTPDTSTVSRTNNQHPAAQCRLDTYVSGALCGPSKWNYGLIPGKGMANRNSVDAQNEAFAHSCTTGAQARPACWFAALGSDPAPSECPFGNQAMCDLYCQLDPSQPWCTK
jgi:hypothetical protein